MRKATAVRFACTATLAVAGALPAHAIVSATVAAPTTTYFENFNSGSSFAGGLWANLGSDNYLTLLPGLDKASFGFNVTAPSTVLFDFYYSGLLDGKNAVNGEVSLAKYSSVLGDTPGSSWDFFLANPGANSSKSAHFVLGSPITLAPGSYALSFQSITAGWSTTSALKIDDVRIAVTTVTAVPEPASVAMLLAGLGVVGAVVRRRGVRL